MNVPLSENGMGTRENRNGIKKNSNQKASQKALKEQKTRERSPIQVIELCTHAQHMLIHKHKSQRYTHTLTQSHMHSHINIKWKRHESHSTQFYSNFFGLLFLNSIFSDVCRWIVVVTATVDHHFFVFECVYLACISQLSFSIGPL